MLFAVPANDPPENAFFCTPDYRSEASPSFFQSKIEIAGALSASGGAFRAATTARLERPRYSPKAPYFFEIELNDNLPVLFIRDVLNSVRGFIVPSCSQSHQG